MAAAGSSEVGDLEIGEDEEAFNAAEATTSQTQTLVLPSILMSQHEKSADRFRKFMVARETIRINCAANRDPYSGVEPEVAQIFKHFQAHNVRRQDDPVSQQLATLTKCAMSKKG